MIKRVNEQEKAELTTPSELLEKYADISRYGLQYQADSFSAADSKSQTYIGVLSVFVALILGLLAISFKELSCTAQNLIKIFTAIELVLLLINILFFCKVIRSQKFSYGYSVLELREIDNNTNTLTQICKEIADSQEKAFIDNVGVLYRKIMWLNWSEKMVIFNFVFVIIYSLIFIFLL